MFDMQVKKVDELDYGGSKRSISKHAKDVSDIAPTTPEHQDAVERRREMAFEYRVAGMKHKNIARKIRKQYKENPNLNEDNLPKNYDANQASNDVNKEVNKHVKGRFQSARTYVAIEVRRIQKMINGLWERATKMNGKEAELKAVDRIIRLQKRMARMLGLDAPEKVDIMNHKDEDEYSGFEWADPKELELSEEEINSRVQKVTEEDE
jgi:hypothetical protein